MDMEELFIRRQTLARAKYLYCRAFTWIPCEEILNPKVSTETLVSYSPPFDRFMND
jgi:hypothetical protein